MKYVEIPQDIKLPYWVESMCRGVDGTGSYKLFSIAIDLKNSSRKNMKFLLKWKIKRLIKKNNKTHEEYLKLIQIATHFDLRSLSKQNIIYDSTTDFYK